MFATVKAIAAELSKDRAVRTLEDGSIEAVDDMGFVLGFQVTIRRPITIAAEAINAPGASPQRPPNVVAVNDHAVIVPRTLSHVGVLRSRRGESRRVLREAPEVPLHRSLHRTRVPSCNRRVPWIITACS